MKQILFAFLLLALPCSAQTLTVAGYAAGSTNAGLSGPIAGIQTTLTARQGRLEFAGRGSYLPRYQKAYSGDGRAYSVEADLRIYAGRFFVAPGFSRATAWFDGTSRTSTHASVGGGYSDRNVTASGFYHLPDRTRYKLQKVGMRIEYYRPLTERVVFVVTPGLEVFWYEFEGRQVGVKPSISAGVGYRW